MKPERINQLIGEFAGWIEPKPLYSVEEAMKAFPEDWETRCPYCGCHFCRCAEELALPNYHGDLNACHKAENRLLTGASYITKSAWRGYLQDAATLGATSAESATAPQRCEAILKTIGKWEE